MGRGHQAWAATAPPITRWLAEPRKCVLGYLRDAIDGVGWDAEYPRDVWLLRRLGYPGRDAVLRFDEIAPAWLRALTKRWARWRLSTGTALTTALADVRAITGFAQSFPSLQRGPEALTRELLDAHLAHLTTKFPNPKAAPGRPAAWPVCSAQLASTAGNHVLGRGSISTARTIPS